MIVGKKIKEIREKAGLSQEEFAEKLAISRQAVSKWEREIALPDIENIMYISDLFNVSLDEIVKGDEKMTKKIISDNKNAKFTSKFFIGTFLTFVLTVFFFVGSIMLFGGAGFYGYDLFFMPLPLIILVVFPIIYQCILYGNVIKKGFITVFGSDFSKNDLEYAYNIFKNYGQTIWITAVLLIAMCITIGLRTIDDLSGLGQMYQFILNTIVYAGLLNLIIVLPYKTIVKRKIIIFI
jgi:transcriptional regulator with XRE-family HTH domain